ncbi:hypothetical protein [Weissella sagaensis]|uniref:Uncharacterized protein n=1 Tax=Weissella sagaensis TaxID=2559928 RepID=A0ABW1RTN4_9LACO|nr:hypothetical protein [Weissella sagaensis]MBU7567872.1 hypothetical protein [Weissella hellenica]UEG66845.1 hypothetical protein GZH44_08805 [Weissella hellenica]
MFLLLIVILAVWIGWRVRLRRTKQMIARNINAANARHNFQPGADVFDGEFEEVKNKH